METIRGKTTAELQQIKGTLTEELHPMQAGLEVKREVLVAKRLNDLEDITISNPKNGEVLGYEDGEWKNKKDGGSTIETVDEDYLQLEEKELTLSEAVKSNLNNFGADNKLLDNALSTNVTNKLDNFDGNNMLKDSALSKNVTDRLGEIDNIYADGFASNNLLNIKDVGDDGSEVQVTNDTLKIYSANNTYARGTWVYDGLTVGQAYTLSFDYTNTENMTCSVRQYNGNTQSIVKDFDGTSGNVVLKFTPSTSNGQIRFYSNPSNVKKTNTLTLAKVQLNKGENELNYSPYSKSNVELTEKLDNVDSQVNADEKEISLIWVDNSYVASDGSFVAFNGWSRTDYIDISKYSILEITNITPASSDLVYNAFYDKDKKAIKTSFKIEEGTKLYKVPEGAVYLAMSLPTAKKPNRTVVGKGLADTLTKELDNVTDALTLDNLDFKHAPIKMENYFIGADGVYVSNSDCVCTDYISLAGITSITFNQTRSNSPSICFYDKNKKYISGEAYAGRTQFTVIVPSNACYAIISIYKTVISDSSLSIVGNTITKELGNISEYSETTSLKNADLRKQGKIVHYNASFSATSATAWATFDTIPEGYRPRYSLNTMALVGGNRVVWCQFLTSGIVRFASDITNETIVIDEVYFTN